MSGVGHDGRVHPRVSIALPVYNGARYIAEAIESVRSQTFEDWELIITDNASEDDTLDICRRHEREDPRIRIVAHAENHGAARNYNFGFHERRGEYFAWLAHDDLWDPHFLERCVEALDRQPATVLAFSHVDFINEGSEIVETKDLTMRTGRDAARERLHDVLMVWHDCLPVFGLMRSDVLETTCLIAPFSSGDLLLLAHMAVRGPFHIADETLFQSRRHEEQSLRRYNIWVDHHAYTQWMEGDSGSGRRFSQWRILRELSVLVASADLSAVDRAGCFLAVGRWSIRYRSILRKEFVLWLRTRASRR